MTISNRHFWPLQELTETLLAVGRTDEGFALGRELIDRARTHYVPPISVGCVLAMLGRIDEAIDWLERAYRERDALPIFNYWPFMLPNNDPRVAALFRRVGLTPNPRFAG